MKGLGLLLQRVWMDGSQVWGGTMQGISSVCVGRGALEALIRLWLKTFTRSSDGSWMANVEQSSKSTVALIDIDPIWSKIKLHLLVPGPDYGLSVVSFIISSGSDNIFQIPLKIQVI